MCSEDLSAAHGLELVSIRLIVWGLADCAVVVVDIAGTLLLVGERRVEVVVEVAIKR